MSENTAIRNCANCNYELTFNPAAKTLYCKSCGSVFTLAGDKIKEEVVFSEAPQLMIPFTFNKEVFEKAAIEWLSLGDYTPADILDSFYNYEIKGVYVPLYQWHFDYTLKSPAGIKADFGYFNYFGSGIKGWPTEMLEFARSVDSEQKKRFDETYTLGFEIIEEYSADNGDFNQKAKEQALAYIVRRNNLRDSKSIEINKMSFTRTYISFWINRYNYLGENYMVAMSGFDATKIFGNRPIDTKLMNSGKPTFRLGCAAVILFFVLTLVLMIFENIWSHFIVQTIGMIATLSFAFVAPIAFLNSFIKRRNYTDALTRLKELRTKKMTERLARFR
jgi:hypothetical protein